MLTENEILLLQFHKLSSEIIVGEDLKNSLKRVLENVRKMLHFSRVYLLTENKNHLLEVLMVAGKNSLVMKSLKWPKDTMGGPSYVFSTGKALHQHSLLEKSLAKYYPESKKEQEVLFSVYRLGGFGKGDILLAPIKFRGRTVGVLGADRIDKPLDKAELAHLEEFAAQIGWALELARLQAENREITHNLQEIVNKRTAEIKALQEKLLHSERLAAMGELVAGVAHEIKSPLTGIMGFIELLKEEIEDRETRQILSGLSFCAKQLQSVVKNFLGFSKKNKPKFQLLDINKTIVNALILTEHQLRGMNIAIHKKLASGLPLIKGDQTQLIQVFTNLFINAGHAMEPQGGKLIISTTLLSKPDKTLLIKITDSGPGMSAEVKEKIFQAFYTTKQKGKGTGLGLSICLNIIQQHQGKIEVDSVPGEGTTFNILLPAQ